VHFADGTVPADYQAYTRRKYLWILGGAALLFVLFIFSISIGAVNIPAYDVLLSLANGIVDRITAFLHPGAAATVPGKWDLIIWNIRLPQALAAIVAGVGEELAIRGVLQPRFGIPLSVMVFASLHAYQYAWDGVLSVFLAGLVFALLRERTNTSVCAITHATYDLVLFGLLMAGIGWV